MDAGIDVVVEIVRSDVGESCAVAWLEHADVGHEPFSPSLQGQARAATEIDARLFFTGDR